ncbi:hypothetical protein K501DRAFT_277391 [Backusella circina FSU 941]|nr:hypothetical protein K501DRAFT_277391 [Backusella circina FSU 941]
MQSATCIVSSNTPTIEDHCFSTKRNFASEETLTELNRINANYDSNLSLKSIPGAFHFFSEFIKLDKGDLIDGVFMKFALIDSAINYERITPTPVNDERTIFAENIVPLFKYFGNITKTISFRW